MGTTRMLGRGGDGPPVYTYEAVPGVPPVSVARLGMESQEGSADGMAKGPRDANARLRSHSHDFLLLFYFERGGGSLRLGEREWPVETGDAYIVAPSEVVGIGEDNDGPVGARGWSVYFPPEVLGDQAPGSFLSWRAHPLLFPFVGGVAGGAQRLKVPQEDRASWSERYSALDMELSRRRDGYREAALAHLTLLLVEVSRLASDVVGDLRLKDEPLLAAVFGFIEEHSRDPISLRDVARAVGLSAGHLTTVVRRKTGRTVLEWITERRMAEARMLLVATDLRVEEVARKVGYADSGYFVKTFRRAHGATPLGWRRAGGNVAP